MALSLVLTFSRSGIGGLALAGLVAAAMVLRRARNRSARSLGLSYLGVVALVVLGWAGTDRIATRFEQTSHPGEGRLDIWRDTLGIIRDFPLTGTGLSTFASAFVIYETPGPRYASEAHNDYLQLAAEGGVLLGLPILCLIAVFIREVRRRFREDTELGDWTTYWIRAGAACGLFAIAVQETVEFSLQLPGNAVLFLILAVIAVHRSEPVRRPSDFAARDSVGASVRRAARGSRSGILAWDSQ